MNDISDSEVGELWRKAVGSHPWGYADWQIWMQSVIRKLVEDRQTLYWHQLAERPGGTNPQEALRFALRDFGIDPTEFKT